MKYILISIIAVLSFSFSKGQELHIIQDGDKRFMHSEYGSWVLNDGLTDGRWIVCVKNKDTTLIRNEVSYLNGVKHGKEVCYFSYSKDKSAETNYNNGAKHGMEIQWNANGTVSYSLAFDNGKLNGPMEINWSEGAKKVSGYYKNNIRDSIWTFYDSDRKAVEKRKKVVRYESGRQFLLKAWDYKGNKVVEKGNGEYEFNPYKKGIRNGSVLELNDNGDTAFYKLYKNGFLTKEISSYYNWNSDAGNNIGSLDYVKYFNYIDIPEIDTSLEWIDTYITDIYETKVNYNYPQLKTGNWLNYYKNGNLFRSGEYVESNRSAIWKWYYPNGNIWIKADYENNNFIHYDSSGTIKSNFKGEFVTTLTEQRWFVNTTNYNKELYLDERNHNTVTDQFVFEANGKLKKSDWLECGKKIGELNGNWKVEGNLLTINIEEQFYAEYLLNIKNNGKVKLTPTLFKKK